MKYFLHDTNAFADEKVTKVFMKYGYEGVGLFFCVLEKLAFQEKPIETKVLKKQLFMDRKLFQMLKFMIDIELLEEQDEAIFSGSVMNVAEKYVTKKEKTRKKVAEWRARRGEEEGVTGYKVVTGEVTEGLRNHPKEKKIKEKESKENDDDTSSSPVVENSAGEADSRRVLQAETRLVQKEPKEESNTNNFINNNISLKDAVGIEELKARAFKNVRFCFEFDAMGVPVEHLEGWLGAFNSWLEYIGETIKQERDYRAHFKSWLLKQPYKTADPKTYKPAQEQVAVVKHVDADDVMRKRYGG